MEKVKTYFGKIYLRSQDHQGPQNLKKTKSGKGYKMKLNEKKIRKMFKIYKNF